MVGETYRGIQRVLWITLGLNLLAMAAKLAVGYWTKSLSLMADGFDTLFDSASNVIGLIGIQQVAGDDKGHDVNLRRLGGGWSLSMHLDLPPALNLAEAHRVTTRIESELRARIPHLEQVMVHTEPAAQ